MVIIHNGIQDEQLSLHLDTKFSWVTVQWSNSKLFTKKTMTSQYEVLYNITCNL